MRILISGAGIAGPALAYWLNRYGFTTTIVEKAPELRTGGYIIDFWGAGFEIADRMGLMPEIRDKGYMMEEVRVVDANGKRIAGFPAAAFARSTRGRFVSLPRGTLAETIFGSIAANVETIFGDSIARLEEDGNQLKVTFERGGVRNFHLVIGADGLHSRVRELAFGPQRRYEKYLGYKVAAFEVEGYRPRDELVYVMYTEVGRQVSRFAMHGDRTMFLFTFADERADCACPGDVPAQKALLRERFGNSGWECPRILEALDGARDLYFDRISQVRMDTHEGLWTRGRVSLVGDAAFCVSLLAGQGSALAMTAAYILAGELRRANGDHAARVPSIPGALRSVRYGQTNGCAAFCGSVRPQVEAVSFCAQSDHEFAANPLDRRHHRRPRPGRPDCAPRLLTRTNARLISARLAEEHQAAGSELG